MDTIDFVATFEDTGTRLDRFLAARLAGISRSAVQKAIRQGHVFVSGTPCTQPSRRLRAGETITWAAPAAPLLTPTVIELPVIYEDMDIVVVDKPAGLVVHPGAGTHGGTLVEGLLATRELPVDDDPARPGIVHRLDKETTGVLVVAKTRSTLVALKQQFTARAVTKEYIAQVEGTIPEDEGLIDAPIGRDPVHPRRMTVTPRGRVAQTTFRVLARFPEATLLRVRPHTGRTHQLRVHLHYIGHPVCGDSIYGTPGEHLFLHAWWIAFTHPRTGNRVRFSAPIPPWFPHYPYDELLAAEDDSTARR